MNIKNEISKQKIFWKTISSVLPLISLFILVITYLIGNDSYLHILIIAIISVFFIISFFWWLWTLEKLVTIIEKKTRVEQKIDILLKEIDYIKEETKAIKK